MKRDDLNQNVYTNVNISDEMIESLISDLNNGRRVADIRFRYSTAIMALIIVAVIGCGGIGVNAAYTSYKNRLKEMTAKEQENYEQELAADVYETGDESKTRGFTNEEYKRYLELEDAYYENGVFPEGIMKHVEKLDEITEDELAFVEEINKIHIPVSDMTDEQILQLIDHEAKYLYTIEQNAEMNNDENIEVSGPAISFDISAEDERSLKEQSIALIREFYGEEIDSSWKFNLYDCDMSAMEGFDDAWEGYEICFEENDAPNATMYQLRIPKKKDGVFIINCSGKKYYGDRTEYTREEAKAYEAEAEEAAKAFLKEKFGLGVPDRVEMTGFDNGDGEEVRSQEITYEMYYGEDHISITWNILNKKIYSVAGKGLL